MNTAPKTNWEARFFASAAGVLDPSNAAGPKTPAGRSEMTGTPRENVLGAPTPGIAAIVKVTIRPQRGDHREIWRPSKVQAAAIPERMPIGHTDLVLPLTGELLEEASRCDRSDARRLLVADIQIADGLLILRPVLRIATELPARPSVGWGFSRRTCPRRGIHEMGRSTGSGGHRCPRCKP